MYQHEIRFKVYTRPYDQTAGLATASMKSKLQDKMLRVPKVRKYDNKEFSAIHTFESPYEHLKPGIVFQEIETLLWPAGKPIEIDSGINEHKGFGWYSFMAVVWFDVTITYYKLH